MFRPRVIPVLLLKNLGLVKSVRFKRHQYIGDPINAVKLFNDLKADELVFLDILASREKRLISLDFVRRVGDEANMPFAVGGGIKNLDDIKYILLSGAEKVVINAQAHFNPDFIREAAAEFGSSTIAVAVDIKRTMFGNQKVFVLNGNIATKRNPLEYVKELEDRGAGELIINSINRDGTYLGYDNDLIKVISNSVSIPVVASGGASSTDDLMNVCSESNANAAAAGSFFVYYGRNKAVLINYPSGHELRQLFRL
jgi:imidazole glycerol-phosphate synthase subunit HisF